MSEKHVYRYETHLHTYPVSKCSHIGVRDALIFYKELGYAGVFVTNHFIDGNINMDKNAPYEELIRFYFSDYEEALRLSGEIGIDVFCGVEISLSGTHFLVYGLDKEWFLAHPEIRTLKGGEYLQLLIDSGALVIQAHPYRTGKSTVSLSLYPNLVHGVEIYNTGCTDGQNQLARYYADCYSLPYFAGSDYHGKKKEHLFGIETDFPIANEKALFEMVKNGEVSCFVHDMI